MRDARAIGIRLLWAGIFVAMSLLWAALVEAKNCSLLTGNCVCGDTITVGGTFGVAQEVYCPNVDQAFKVAAGVTVDCSGSWFTSNHGRDHSAAIRVLGGKIVNCWAWDGWEIGMRLQGNGSQVWYGGVGGDIEQEGIHANNGTRRHIIYGVNVQVPQEALYLQGAHESHIEWSTLVGGRATYANDWSSKNHVKSCTLAGGLTRAHFDNAGSGNWWEGNNYNGGVIKSTGGSDYPNYITPYPNATVQNTDGSLVY